MLSGPALCAMYESTVTNPILTWPNPKHHMRSVIYVKWNLSIKGALNKDTSLMRTLSAVPAT